MKPTSPQIFLLARPSLNVQGLHDYLHAIGAPDWTTDTPSDAEALIEIAGRSCYRSFKPGLNPNVTKVRDGNTAYLENILKVKHGSVIEHANWTFAFSNVSRILTHELVRHRAGVAISQESLRFVRLTELKMWLPAEIRDNPDALAIVTDLVERMETAQQTLSDLFRLDTLPFHQKKVLTSAMRRIAPMGLATTIIWSANARALRWIIENRTTPEAETEIRLAFGQVAQIMQHEAPTLFGDFTESPLPDGTSQWIPEHSKI